jgi:dipeptidase D
MKPTTNLSIEEVWKYFEEICQIPRLSKSEERIIAYLLDFAKRNEFESKTDDVGNILIRKPASAGMENRKTVVLQSHLDMVGEKEPSSNHDFENDPIIPVRDGEWIRATDTTLGADCGIGIAAQMVILENKDFIHGPIECLFTVDEESGMTGAKFLKPGFMSGKILLNLDSEDEGELFIGCAGGIDTVGTFRFSPESPSNPSEAYRVIVEGLKGGHSGDEIHKSPGNPIKILGRFLLDAGNKFGLRLAVFDGGNMRNAIPRDAFAIITVPEQFALDIEQYFREFSSAISTELKDYEPGMTLGMEKAELPGKVLPMEEQVNFLQALDCCPHGVVSWSPNLEGLVETSTNLASMKFPDTDKAIITTSQRSSVDSAKNNIALRVKQCFEKGGGTAKHSDGYPGWSPNTDSEILNITRHAYAELFGIEPEVRAIHAGLECGLILEKYPGLDMLSFGPTIKGAHTPTERIHVESTVKFWKLLLEVLGRIPAN